MLINSDINILGGLPDWNLINVFLNENINTIRADVGLNAVTAIKTDKSVKRFEKAITDTLLKFKNLEVAAICKTTIETEAINSDVLLLLFWNASYNNDLLNYLNEKVFFPAFYSGRVAIKSDEIAACINELKQEEESLKKWSDLTISTVASKYLTLMKKLGLMEGAVNKTILHPHLNDKMFVLFVYWLLATEEKNNLMNSVWLQYAFSEKPFFVDRILQKRFSKFFNVTYTGDNLNIETIISYNEIYDSITKS